MTASGDHVKALLKSHASGDDEEFYSVAMQVAAGAARRGHHQLASDLKQLIDTARSQSRASIVTPIAQPRGELADLVTASFPDVRLRDLIAPPDVLDRINRVIAEQRQRHALAEQGFNPAHRLLLQGPPGTGKTMTAAVLAHELSIPLLTTRLDTVLSKYLGETATKLRVLFDAVATQRGVYLFDEFDALGADRGGNDVGEARRILNAFLVFLDNASPESIVVAATNHSRILDKVLFRRFDLVINYRRPDNQQALAVLRTRLGALARGLRWQTLGPSTEGLSHSELVKSAETAAKRALLVGSASVTLDELRTALDERRADSSA